jgi:murein DD-endopeptidase MepM/ murein hydrolase activator NlpD
MKFYLLLLFVYTPIFAQDNYPKDFFRSPLDIPLQLAGNFGELRANHFHAGLDCRTQQKEGFNVYASGDGYISRIKISPYGYGKAIYIDHPNGYTTVYGHLKCGSARIEAYIKANQYKNKTSEIELFPKPGELVVTKGEVIALSGNTGGSEGPHLHFEFRDTKSEKIINPLFFGFDTIILDHKKPVITSLYVFPLDEHAVVNQSAVPIVLDVKPMEDGSYIAQKVVASGKIGFGINAYDSNDYSDGKNGVYKVETYTNGNLSFGYTFDTFAFDDSRYVNALIDYPRYRRTAQRIQKLFMKQPYHLALIRSDDHNGILDVEANSNQTFRIEASDFNGNKIVINVPIEYAAAPANTPVIPIKTNYLVPAEKDYNFEKDNFSVFIPARTFYEDEYLDFVVKGHELEFGDDNIPVHTNFLVSIEDKTIPEKERDKWFVASVTGKKLSYNPTKRKGNTFSAYTKNLGGFKLAKDTIAPKISIAKSIEGKWLTKVNAISLNIGDSLSGIKEYNGYLNGNWVLFEYDYKSKKITHKFDDDAFVQEGRNELKVVVTDNVGNSAIFETHFFRSQNP